MFFVGSIGKLTLLGIIILIFFARALTHYRDMTGYYVVFEISGKTVPELLPEKCLQLQSVSILLNFALLIT